MYKLAYTERFKKAFNDLTNNEQIQFQNKMKLFVENVLHPSLRTKKIKGQKDKEQAYIRFFGRYCTVHEFSWPGGASYRSLPFSYYNMRRVWFPEEELHL